MNTSNNSVIEINLLEFFKKVILKWKAILIIGVSGGILLSCIYSFSCIRKSSDATIRLNEENETNIVDSLGLVEKDAVDVVADRIIRVDRMCDYSDKAAIFSINPLECKKMVYVYSVQTGESYDSSLASSLLQQFVFSEEFSEKVAESMKLDAKENHIDELIDCKFSNSFLSDDSQDDGINYKYMDSTISISIILPEDINTENVSETVKETINEYIKIERQKVTGLNVKCEGEYSTFEVDRDLQNQKFNFMNTIMVEKNAIKPIVTAFSDNQKQYLIEVLKNNGITSEEITIYTGGFKTDDRDAIDNTFVYKNSYLVGCFILGLIVFVLIYIVILFCWYCYRPKAGRIFGMGNPNNIHVIGTMRGEDKASWLSKILYRLDDSKEKQVISIISAIVFRLNKEKESEVTLLCFGEFSKEAELINKLWKEQSDVCLKVVYIPLNENVLIYENLERIDSRVVTIVKNDSILLSNLNRIYSLMQEKKIDIIGCIEVL